MPSCANTSASSADASGSLTAQSRSPCWTTVTRTPNREYTCASSHPIGPPPSTTSEPGTSVTCTASRLVQNGVSASPSTGGSAGPGAGVERRTRLVGHGSEPSAGAPPPRAGRPAGRRRAARSPRASCEPLDGDPVVPVVGGLPADPLGDGAQLDRPSTSPASSDARPASASASPARTIILAGHAAVVGTLAADQVLVHRRRLRVRPSRSRSPASLPRAPARRPPDPPAARRHGPACRTTMVEEGAAPQDASGRRRRRSDQAGLLRSMAPRTPLTNCGDSSVERSRTSAIASLTATASGTSST